MFESKYLIMLLLKTGKNSGGLKYIIIIFKTFYISNTPKYNLL